MPEDMRDESEILLRRWWVFLSLMMMEGQLRIEGGRLEIPYIICDAIDRLNWKDDEYNQVGTVRYNIIPTQNQGYAFSTCCFHLQKDQKQQSFDGSGIEHHWRYHIKKALMKDGAGNEIGRVGSTNNNGDGDLQAQGDGNSLNLETRLPNKFVIKSKARGHPKNYIHFINQSAW